jgi:hypothetical protein
VTAGAPARSPRLPRAADVRHAKPRSSTGAVALRACVFVTATPRVDRRRVFLAAGRSASSLRPAALVERPRLVVTRIAAPPALASRDGRRGDRIDGPAGPVRPAGPVVERVLPAAGARRVGNSPSRPTSLSLDWRAQTPPGPPRAITPAAVPENPARTPQPTPAIAVAPEAGPAGRAFAARQAPPQLDPSTIDRLTDTVLHRLDRRMRIERERRGL